MDNELTTAETSRAAVERRDIPGWGVDADPLNDATYPMRDRSQDDSPGMNWERPSQQSSDVEVLQSVEHNRRPAVFGTSTPPTGLSGAIRRSAYRYSESQWAHWLLLMLADRVNSAEGVADDLRRGTVPNLFDEMGLAAEWKYNRQPFIRKAAAAAAVTGGAAALTYLAVRAARRRRQLQADE
ncbi:hypothetical protein [Phenylobacterium sp.]|jgi:hypothetical protein|uniref:hypothetical protein n=1 Tax=Phenylobacterium sp. TaxID=1871053 RepID=UPI002E31D2D1|nr:hypothetical protein [Phenylobacterium sp.]HEX2561957.1 hypothetical protein [Phenylobacterium sp.]